MPFKLHADLRTFSGRARSAATVMMALLCSACGMNLRPAPVNQAADLNGEWQLPALQRESLLTQLRNEMEQARAKQVRRDQKRRGRNAPPEVDIAVAEAGAPVPSTAQSRPGGAINNWQVREQQEQQTALINAVAPSSLVQIVQTPSRIELLPEASARRRFDVGVASMLVSSYANLEIESGWQGNVFVVHSRDAQQDVDIVERYQRQAPDRLSLQLELELPDLKRQIFSVSYVLIKK